MVTAPAPAAPLDSGRLVSDVADKLREIVSGSARPETARAFGFKLKPFSDAFAGRTVESITPPELISWRAKIAKSYKPWTANGYIVAARRLGALAVELGLIKAWPVNLLKTVPLGETKSKAWTPEQISNFIKILAKKNETFARMFRLQFLAAMRPFSVPELIREKGEWTEEGVFALERSKTERQTGERVRVCLSPAALAELEAIRKLGNAPKSGPMYRQAVQRAGGPAPHALRHSAATALAKLGVADETIETALGHSMSRVKRTYRPANYQAAREALAKLAELVPGIPSR
ncbi:MAG: tyrosine-type recombinase/integrase [Phycisphaeraceae bacterium]|nr:tyrosine-type recombinase/integrase [Phycisphaeraceae bacterium]